MLLSFISASELISGSKIRKKDGRNLIASDLERIPDGAIVIDTSKNEIVWVGNTTSWKSQNFSGDVVDLKGMQALVPGFVDAHTHMVFGGDRSDEFSRRCAGETYESIAAAGGGIQATVRATQTATIDALLEHASKHAQEAYAYGVRTLEVKSGYGLTLEAELKLLEVIQRLSKKHPEIHWVPTYMGAHAIPVGYTEEQALEDIIQVQLPKIAEQGVAQFCDIFVDAGYFSTKSISKLSKAAGQYGLKLKVHADEMGDTGSTQVAVQEGAVSVEHLLCISETGIEALSKSNTTAVLLPGTAFFLKAAYAPARTLLERGARVAIATDFNPGSCPMNNLPFMMTLAALYMEMSCVEIFAGVTYNAAKALDLAHLTGSLEPGLRADLAVLPFKNFESIYYQAGYSALTFPIKGWRDYNESH